MQKQVKGLKAAAYSLRGIAHTDPEYLLIV